MSASNGVDWLTGPMLPGLVSRLGMGRAPLAPTDVQQHSRHRSGAGYFELFFDEMRDRALTSGSMDAATFDAAYALNVG